MEKNTVYQSDINFASRNYFMYWVGEPLNLPDSFVQIYCLTELLNSH
jgi:hypothetical protein